MHLFVNWISSAFDAKTLGFSVVLFFFLIAIFVDSIMNGANIFPIIHQRFCNKNLVDTFTEATQDRRKSKLIFA